MLKPIQQNAVFFVFFRQCCLDSRGPIVLFELRALSEQVVQTFMNMF